jgi:hypothetical protein
MGERMHSVMDPQEEKRFWDQEMFRRKVFRHAMTVMVALTLVNTILNTWSIFDRRAIHETEQIVNARLNARSEIHILHVRAYVQQRPLTETERNRIVELWEEAKYPENMKKLLEEIRVQPETAGRIQER